MGVLGSEISTILCPTCGFERKYRISIKARKTIRCLNCNVRFVLDSDNMKVKCVCIECGQKFIKNLKQYTTEIQCPKCSGYDIEII